MRQLLICLPLLLLAAPSFAGDEAKDSKGAKDVADDKAFDKLAQAEIAFVVETPKAHVFKNTLKRKWTKKELAGGTSKWLVIRLTPKQYSGKQAQNAWRKQAPVSILSRRPQVTAIQKALSLKKLGRVSLYVPKLSIIRSKGGRYVVRRLSTFKKRIKGGTYTEPKPKAVKAPAKPKGKPTSKPTRR